MLGDAPGWSDLGVGDIVNRDKKIIIELKNRMTTMNSSSKSDVMKKLQKQHDDGFTAILGIINGKPKTTVYKSGVHVAIGKHLFNYVYGNTTDVFKDVIEGVKRVWMQTGMIDQLADEFMQKAMVNE